MEAGGISKLMETKKKVKVKKIGLLKYRLLVLLSSKKTGRRTRWTLSASADVPRQTHRGVAAGGGKCLN